MCGGQCHFARYRSDPGSTGDRGCPVPGRAGSDGPGRHAALKSRRGQRPFRVVPVVHGQPDLLQVVGAADARGRFARLLHPGKSIPIRTEMIEITTRSSISVKPRRVDRPAMAFLLVIRSAINSGFGRAGQEPAADQEFDILGQAQCRAGQLHVKPLGLRGRSSKDEPRFR